MEMITGAIFAVAFMGGNQYVGSTIGQDFPACEKAPYVTVSRPGESYAFEVSQCELADHPEYIVQK